MINDNKELRNYTDGTNNKKLRTHKLHTIETKMEIKLDIVKAAKIHKESS